MKIKLSIVCIEENSILLIKSNKFWQFPNDWLEIDETELECLDKIFKKNLLPFIFERLYREITGSTPYRKEEVIHKVYFVNRNLNFSKKSKHKFFTIEELDDLELSFISKKIIKLLKNDFYLEN